MRRSGARISRRSILKATTAGLAAGFAGPLASRAGAASTAANNKLNLAVVGCGGQGRGVMGGMLSSGEVNLVALCDPDAGMIEQARSAAANHGGAAAKAYEDYRRLLDDAGTIDAVLIATPDHWHAPLCKAFMAAGKHIYCEKPLTHSIAEARELRELARQSKVVTQMGNQGSASESLRRCVEIIQSGALGQVREIYSWGIGVDAREGSASGEDPVPSNLNWDLWVGPSEMRPYKKDTYHPYSWRGWFDFGNGGLADFCCHAINLPMRALDLGYPERLVTNFHDGKQVAGKAAVEFHFPQRGKLDAVVLHWMGGQKPREELVKPLAELFEGKVPDGLLIVGEKGIIHTSHWNTDGLIRLEGEEMLRRVSSHPATKDLPKTLPRTNGHDREWIAACRGEGKTFSDFETGGKLTEIGFAGVVAVRAGKSLDWDGEAMKATNDPDADRFIRTEHRKKWL
ncbi:MAG: Gfo/Idh/MocA family protein [Armatimonadota bacterium]